MVFFLGLRLRRRKGKAENGGEEEEQNLNHTHMETHINMSVRCYAFDVSTLSSKGGCFSSPFSTHHPTSSITCLHAWCRNLFPTECSSDFTSVPSLQKLLAFEALSLCRINSSFVSLRDHRREPAGRNPCQCCRMCSAGGSILPSCVGIDLRLHMDL